ncbi:MAG: Diguanylate cyclase protein [Gemmatimonadetes bacterium]|nr:Diguanylate cyclase protein [Gemmatimonadota bacterium]
MSDPASPAGPEVPPPTDARAEASAETRHLAVLNEIARIATLDLEPRPMLQRITDALARAFRWEFVACVSADFEHERFVCEAVTSRVPTEIEVGYTRALGSGVVGRVALSGRSELLDDVEGVAHYIETLPGARSELCVPVRHQGRTVAILNAESRQPGAFRGQLALLETVAEQVAGAIASARLYQRARHGARLLQMVSELSRSALEAADLDELLDRTVRYVQRHFEVGMASVLLHDEEADDLVKRAHAGSGPGMAPVGTRWPLDRGVVGRSFRLGEPQLVLNVAADPDFVRFHESTASQFVAPIRFRGRVLGVVNVEAGSAEPFSSENLVVFQTVAAQLGGAIHLAAMNRELEDANERLRHANQRLERLSATDGLTGVANRRNFDETLDLEWRRAHRAAVPLSLVMIDLDCFKGFNDAHGHQAGDEALRAVARALRDSLSRAGDAVARYGGEEFAVLLPGAGAEHAARIAERLREAIQALAIAHGASTVAPVATASMGVATGFPGDGSTESQLVQEADRALYLAKHLGRNRVAVGRRLTPFTRVLVEPDETAPRDEEDGARPPDVPTAAARADGHARVDAEASAEGRSDGSAPAPAASPSAGDVDAPTVIPATAAASDATPGSDGRTPTGGAVPGDPPSAVRAVSTAPPSDADDPSEGGVDPVRMPGPRAFPSTETERAAAESPRATLEAAE